MSPRARTRAFWTVVAVVAILLCVVAADTIVVIYNREYIVRSQKAQNVSLREDSATATANLLATCERFKAIRADDNVSHYADWTIDKRLLQFVIDVASSEGIRHVTTGAAKARKVTQGNLVSVLRSAIAQKAWVPGTICTGKLTVAALASRPAIPFNVRLPSAADL